MRMIEFFIFFKFGIKISIFGDNFETLNEIKIKESILIYRQNFAVCKKNLKMLDGILFFFVFFLVLNF
jgi:hypothetical protein